MKMKPSRKSVHILIFLISAVVLILAALPVYLALSGIVKARVESIKNTVEKETGLIFSYSSLSPSILTGFGVKGIVVSNTDGRRELLKIRKAVFRYRIIPLLKGDMNEACTDLTVDGLSADLSTAADREAVIYVFNLLQKRISNPGFNPDTLSVELPFDIYLKNISLHYGDSTGDYSVRLRKASLVYSKIEQSLDVDLSGNAYAVVGKNRQRYLAGFSASGSLVNGTSGSSLLLHLYDASGGMFRLPKLNFMLTYSQRVFYLRSVQNISPLSVICSFGIDSGDCSFALKTVGFPINSFINESKAPAALKNIKGIRAGIRANCSYNINTGKTSYASSGTLSFPDSFYTGALTASYSLSGTEKKINLPSLVLSGKNCDASFSLSCIYDGWRVSGSVSVPRVVLPNGGIISTEVYIDPQTKGFMCFAPQLFMNEKSFTALQLNVIPRSDSFDFAFEMSDYAHPDAETPGNIKIDGSWLNTSKYAQAGITVSGLYLDSAADVVSFFTSKDPSKKSVFSNPLAPYLFSGEFYISSDLSSISYNVPYALAANTKKDNQFVYLSLDGNDSSVQISQLDFISPSGRVHVSGQADRDPGSKDMFLTMDVNSGAVPYHFTGTLMPDWISVTGDYGTSIEIHRSYMDRIEGSFITENFPVPVLGTIFTVSADTGFSFTEDEGPMVQITRLEVKEAGGKFLNNPRIQLAGNVTKYGAFFDTIAYTDTYSALNGTFKLMWNINSGLFDSANIDFIMQNPLSDEKVQLAASVTNPEGASLGKESLLHSIYFNSQLMFKNFSLNRFFPEQSDNNSVTASLSVSGTADKPYGVISVDSFNLLLAGLPFSASGEASLEDNTVTAEKITCRYGDVKFTNGKASVSLQNYTGKISADMKALFIGKTIEAPLKLVISDAVLEKDSFVPASFAATLSSDSISGTLFTKPFPASVTFLRSDKATTVFTSQNIGLTGRLDDSGAVSLSVPAEKPLSFKLDGTVAAKSLNLAVTNITADLGTCFSLFSIDYFKMYSGALRGSCHISGLQTDPEFTGAVSIAQPDFSLPTVVPTHITAPKILATLNHNELLVPAVTLKTKGCHFIVKMKMSLDRWLFERMEIGIKSEPKEYVPVKLNVNVAEFNGECSPDIQLALEDDILDVTGKVTVQNMDAEIKATELSAAAFVPESVANPTIFVRTDLDVMLGQHVSLALDPLLRCVFVPQTPFTIRMDQSENTFAVKGDIQLRSGDVAYLNRSFYLKQGLIKFNDTAETFDPCITVRAETRERDEDGDEVRIILSAENQYLSNFNPVFSSIPAKSEAEIQSMLGQIAVGDSNNVSSFLLATSDYAIQSLIGRTVENKLRDLLNFDIFSVRTMVLQNTLKQGLSGSSNPSEMTPGNFLDNSTVYIGKYFGSAVYADALMHWSYDKTRVDDSTTAGGLIFQPEIGLELESPFAAIRWNMAPDIDAMLNNKIVASTSVTLSWKFSF